MDISERRRASRSASSSPRATEPPLEASQRRDHAHSAAALESSRCKVAEGRKVRLG